MAKCKWWCVAVFMAVTVAAAPPNRGASAAPQDAPRGELLRLYRSYKLPLPPDGARLVRAESGWRSFDGQGKEIPLDYVGFLIKPATADRPAVVLVGTREFTLASPRSRLRPVNPNPALARDPTVMEAEYLFGLNSSLAFALQCESRGWDGLAQAVLENRTVRTQDPAGKDTPFPLGPSLAHMAWRHWQNALVDPHADRAEILGRMRVLLIVEPSFTGSDRQFVAALEATLAPSRARPGTVEAMIDGLVEVSRLSTNPTYGDPAVLKLGQLGFDAVPALLQHWDDARLTRCASQGQVTPIRTVIRMLIRNLAGDAWNAEDPEVGKAEVLAWWEGARKTGEEAYLVAHVLPAGEEEEWPNQTMLRILANKYPRHLSGIYRTILERRTRIETGPVVDAITRSSLPRETKLELLRRGANHPDLGHRWVALRALQDMDEATFLRVLVATLDTMPEKPKESYWTCPEASYVHLVMRTDDPRAWNALEKVAKRSDIGLRMEFMDPMNYMYIADRHRRQRLEFLSHFLDDDAVRDEQSNPTMYEGPFAGFQFPRLEVRNLAAMEIASILKLDAEPEKGWTPEQWADLRARVRQALADEQARTSR